MFKKLKEENLKVNEINGNLNAVLKIKNKTLNKSKQKIILRI